MSSPLRGTSSPLRAPYHRLTAAAPRPRGPSRPWPTLVTSLLRTLTGNSGVDSAVTLTPPGSAATAAVNAAGGGRRGEEAGDIPEDDAERVLEEAGGEGTRARPRGTAGTPLCPPTRRAVDVESRGTIGVEPAAARVEAEERIPTDRRTSERSAQTGDSEQSTPNAAQLNRERFEENQRDLAITRLAYSLPLLVAVSILMLTFVFTALGIYVSGWVVLIQDGGKPCDQPLNVWLSIVLVNPFVQVLLKMCLQDTRFKALPGSAMPLLLATGVLLHGSCKTCQKTNPQLYSFIRVSMVLYGVCQVVLFFFLFGFVAMLLWLQRHGLLQMEQGPNSPAKPGLIRDIETVPYRAELFDNGPGVDPVECCICQSNFDDERTIKRTPCGHYFHEACLKPWLDRYAKSCPLCREDIEEALADRQWNGSGSVTDDDVV